MGLALTIEKEKNVMYTDFVDAYWYLADVEYSTTQVGILLRAFPSREAKNMERQRISDKFPIGGATDEIYRPELYQWNAMFNIVDIFPNGIPLDENEQKTAIYNYIKTYTGLPFKDVIEN